MRRNSWYWLGATLNWVNVVRHRAQRYKTPRTFNTEDAQRSAEYVVKVVDRWQQRTGIEVAGKRILELGPGPDLGTGFVMLARGATTYTAVDRFELAQLPKSDDPMYQRLRRVAGECDVSKIRYVIDDFPELAKVGGSFDLVASNAVLEHIDDVPGVFRRLGELLAEGGEMCHHIDPRTHTRWLREKDPWNILRYEPAVYRTMRFPGMLNRLLLSDYLGAASSTGFDVVKVTPGTTLTGEQVSALRPHLPPEYRDRPEDDLRFASFTLRCAKRKTMP